MADNKLLGTGGLYYGSNEISKAYMGNNLVWEKKSGIYMVRACNKSGIYSSGWGPWYDGISRVSRNWKIQIGVKNYFTYVTNSYGYKIDLGYVISTGREYIIQLGDYGVLLYRNGITKSNFGETVGVYLEFELTQRSVTCLTYNKKYNYSSSILGIYLANAAISSGVVGYCDCSYHYMKMWDGTTLLHDVIAKKIDGNPGFYDNVTGSFYKESNANNSNFKLYDDYLQV